MSDWNYTKFAKPFESVEAARTFTIEKDFAGHILKRETGFSAVCPTYPQGYYPDAELLESRDNEAGELAAWQQNLQASSDCC